MNRITSTSVIQNYVKVANTFSVHSVNAYEEVAFSNHIEKYFDQFFIDNILSLDVDSGESDIMEIAQKICMGMLVNFAMLEWSNNGEVQISDLGILRTENSESRTAYSNQIKKLAESLLTNGNAYIARLIKLIETNSDEFEDFENQPCFINRNLLVIKTALNFHQYQRLQNPHLLFPVLIGSQKKAIDFELTANFPSSLINEFINGVSNEDPKKAEKLAALEFVKRGLSLLTIYYGMKENLVYVSANGVYQLEGVEETDQTPYKPARDDNFHASANFYKTNGEQYFGKAIDLLISSEVMPAPVIYKPKNFIA